MAKKSVKNLLSSNHFVGRVIRDFASIERYLDYVVLFYFAKNSRLLEFYELIVDKMGPRQKIEVVKRIAESKQFATLLPIVAHVVTFQKIRNNLAHRPWMEELDISSLLNDVQCRRLLENFPKNYNKVLRTTKLRLRRIADGLSPSL